MAMSPRLLRPRATGFNPKSISGLSLWLDASDDAQFTIDAGVTTWRDKSGYSRNATQTTGGKQPVRSNTINGRKVVTFQGIDDTMSVANASDFNAASQTIVVVARQSTAANQALFYKAQSNSAAGVIMRYRTGSSFWMYQKNDASAETLNATANVNTNTNVYTTVLQPSLQAGYVNGSAPAGVATSTLATTYDDTGAIWLGSRRDVGEYLAGDICEVLHWPKALSLSQLIAVHRYLGKKWGISVA